MEAAVKIILTWARENGLGPNPEETKLILFTKNVKYPVLGYQI